MADKSKMNHTDKTRTALAFIWAAMIATVLVVPMVIIVGGCGLICVVVKYIRSKLWKAK